jgi:DNA-binding NarL/FixJ family response regulator
MNPKILLAESNYLLREGLKSLFRDSDYSIGAEVHSGSKLYEAAVVEMPDLVIINFKSENFTVADVAHINAACPAAKILAITERPNKKIVTDAIQNGVNSYLMIDCDRDEILEAFKSTLQGETFFCGKVMNEVNQETVIPETEIANSAFSCKGVKVSAREAEIISLVAEGLTNKQIAEQLFLSTHTVITHRKNIMNKLGLNNTAGLVLFAIRQNIISPNKFLFSN